MTLPSKQIPWALDVLNKTTPRTSSKNPWFMEVWKTEKNCSYTSSTRINCSMIEDDPLMIGPSHRVVQSLVDAAQTYFQALDSLIRKRCPEMLGSPHLIKQCVRGKDLLEHIKNTSFVGTAWDISFDEYGDIEAPYIFEQYHSKRTEKYTEAARWSKSSGAIQMYPSNIDWSYFKPHNHSENGLHTAITNSTAPYDEDSWVPDSVCSNPCGPRQYKQQKELKCCWKCIDCRNNEIINEERDGCEKCPDLMWPDVETATVCVPIEPRYESLIIDSIDIRWIRFLAYS